MTGFSFAYLSFKTNKDITSFPEFFSVQLYMAKKSVYQGGMLCVCVCADLTAVTPG